MPWLFEAMKDVISCVKLRVGANNRSSADIRMGQPIRHLADTLLCSGRTRGTETSNYPEEKKTIVIPLVVAIERGSA